MMMNIPMATTSNYYTKLHRYDKINKYLDYSKFIPTIRIITHFVNLCIIMTQ